MSRPIHFSSQQRRRMTGIALVAYLASLSLCCLGVRWSGRFTRLCVGEPELRTVEVAPGASLPQVATALEAAGLARAIEVELAALDGDLHRRLNVRNGTLEGRLATGRFQYTLGTPVRDVLADLVGEQRRRLDSEQRLERAVALGLSDAELVTLASLLERESGDAEERRRLAGVWLTRMHAGLRLESRAARAVVESRAAPAEPAADDPFDTHRHAGLPPAPIASPGLQAIDAVLSADPGGHPVLFEGGRFAIDAAERAALAAVPADPAPERITRDTHYYVSNEYHHQAFHQAVVGLGGTHVGVGTDQNYLLAGWSRPELLILTDFDQAVVDLHRAYRVAFLHAEQPAEFYALWQYEQREVLRGLVRTAYTDASVREATLTAVDEARASIAWRLHRTLVSYTALGLPTFLSDPDQYAHLRALYAANRVVALRADLREHGALQKLGRVLDDHGRTVRVLYLSNAEQYFRYGAAFRRNIEAMPSDAFSLVLRTRPVADDYAYVVQPQAGLRAWLNSPKVRHVSRMVPLSGLRIGQQILLAGGPPTN